MAEKLYEIQVTEGKSDGVLDSRDMTVRAFVDRDYGSGVFVSEHEVFALLTPEQRMAYLSKSDVKLHVTKDVAQRILDIGVPRNAQLLT